MTSADFCRSIPLPLGSDSHCWQSDKPPGLLRVIFPLMSAAAMSVVSVPVAGFEDSGLLAHGDRLPCDSCPSIQCLALGLLQFPPWEGHPYHSKIVPLARPIADCHRHVIRSAPPVPEPCHSWHYAPGQAHQKSFHRLSDRNSLMYCGTLSHIQQLPLVLQGTAYMVNLSFIVLVSKAQASML